MCIRDRGWIRQQGWRARPLSDLRQLEQWLGQGRAAIASSLTPLPAGIAVQDLPPEAGPVDDLAFGLWRGDVTLTRAVRTALGARLAQMASR